MKQNPTTSTSANRVDSDRAVSPLLDGGNASGAFGASGQDDGPLSIFRPLCAALPNSVTSLRGLPLAHGLAFLWPCGHASMVAMHRR
jgi:hypothetical protein